jgi:uncharacterized protein YjbJ (UPF0337 family)
MNKDRIEGKVKDIAGRAERQVGEWTGDTEKQADGTMKQAEGKVQNAWGKVKDAAQDVANDAKKSHDANPPTTQERDDVETADEVEVRGRKAS